MYLIPTWYYLIRSVLSLLSAVTCPYDCVGGDVTTIISPVPPSAYSGTIANVIETITANAEKHAQSRERMKLNRQGCADPVNVGTIKEGDTITGCILELETTGEQHDHFPGHHRSTW